MERVGLVVCIMLYGMRHALLRMKLRMTRFGDHALPGVYI